MLIIALVLAVIGLAALVTAVVTSNELIAWVCIGASVLGVVLLIVDALRERSRGTAEKSADETPAAAQTTEDAVEDYPDEPAEAQAERAAETESADAADETTEAESAGAESAEAESDEAGSDEAKSDEAEAGSDETAAEAAEDDTHDVEPTAEESAGETKN